MGNKGKSPFLDGLIAEMLVLMKLDGSAPPIVSAGLVNESGAVPLDQYRSCLRRFFQRSQIQQLVQEGRRRVWPSLNSEPFQIGPPQEFINRWSHLGINFRLAHMPST